MPISELLPVDQRDDHEHDPIEQRTAQDLAPVTGPRHGFDRGFILDHPEPHQRELDRDQQRHQRRQPAGDPDVRVHQPAQHKDRPGADVDQLAAGPAVDPAALGNVVHEAQKGDGNGKGEKGGKVGAHE